MTAEEKLRDVDSLASILRYWVPLHLDFHGTGVLLCAGRCTKNKPANRRTHVREDIGGNPLGHAHSLDGYGHAIGMGASMTDIIRVVVSPCSGSSTARFEAWVGGRCLSVSETPLLTAARVLTKEGCNPNATLEMWHQGATEFALRGRLGDLALLTVKNGPNAPAFAKWQPFDREALA